MKQYSILICLFIGLFCSNPAFAQKSVDDYAKQFAKETKELEKMQVIIDAVNDGLVKVGASIGNIDRILGRKNRTRPVNNI